jgi:hypothetical protein
MKASTDVQGFYRERILSHLPNAGTYVYDESWDNLIILDACRLDTFEEVNGLEGRLELRVSRGSSTREFLTENFSKHPKNTCFRDVVYVAANPFVSWLVPDKFYKIYPVWDYGWDDKLSTVPPSIVVREAVEARRRHPDKRLIVHFMQPHFPSLAGKFAADTSLRSLRRAVLANFDCSDSPSLRQKGILISPGSAPPFDALARGELEKREVYSAYKENLKIVLSHVDGLVKMLPGTTVLSSDHGELFGERQILFPFTMYGHKAGIRLGTLIRVPWLVITNSKTGVEHEEKKMEERDMYQVDDEKVKDRLRKLGYL